MNTSKKVLGFGGGIRQSNLELYRIVCMLLIVAHHCVVNSGLTGVDAATGIPTGPLTNSPTAINSLALWTLGMWGKTGINCFLLITGYFMCTSTITLRKFVKLLGWIYTYKIIIFLIFLTAGYETLSIKRIVQTLMPVWGFNTNFGSCFIGFWLTIPFWNILIKNMSRRQHELLMFLLLGMYTILGSIPKFDVTFNYVTWFGVIYLVSSYIRLYPHPLFHNKRLWMYMTFISVILAICSMILMSYLFSTKNPTFFVSDSNKIMAVAVAVSSFLWFKNIDLKYHKLINTVGASTFGVLLIHANSDAMREWLWKDTVDCIGHYSLPTFQMILYFCGCVLLIFTICTVIDIIRIKTIEKPFFKWYDRKYNNKNQICQNH